VRELQAGRTSEFINKALLTMEDRLKHKEQEIRAFKERNMGQLPQQLDANLKILEQLQQQLRTISERIRAAEDRTIIFQGQLDQIRKLEAREDMPASQEAPRGESLPRQETVAAARVREDPMLTQLNALKRELASMQTRLKENHPDVMDLKKKIATFESQIENAPKPPPEEEKIVVKNLPPPAPAAPPAPRVNAETERLYRQLKEQHDSALLEAKRLKEEEKSLKEQMNLYQRRIEDTPKREQELTLLSRDYDLLKTNYQSLLDKNLQSQMAENLERKQKGEQFKILDPAVLPEKPIKPDRNKILLIGGLLGIGLGLGLTWFRESLDKSFRTVSDVEDYLGITVLATLPNLKEEKKAA